MKIHKSDQNTSDHLLTLVRVGVGPQHPIQWEEQKSIKNLETLGITTLIKVQERVSPSSAHPVNPLREDAVVESSSPWIWLIDADVLPSEQEARKALSFLKSEKAQNCGLIGGKYVSSPRSTLVERSYNVLCNLWTQAHQIPPAGNLILSKKLVDKSFSLSTVPFGQEEYYLANLCEEKQLKRAVIDLNLIHKNQKNIFSFFRRSLSHVHIDENFKSKKAPYGEYLKGLYSHLKQSPSETALVISYLTFQITASALFQASKWRLKVADRKFRRTGRSPRSPHP